MGRAAKMWMWNRRVTKLLLYATLFLPYAASFAPILAPAAKAKSGRTDLLLSTTNEDSSGGKSPSTDGYNESMLDEARDMLAISDMVYDFTALRRLARAKNNTELSQKLSVPQKVSTVVPVIWENLDLLKGKCMIEKDSMWQGYLSEGESDQHSGDSGSEIILLGDSKEDARISCVYGVGVNHNLKRLTVWFRGTEMDDGNARATWGRNLDMELRLEENPIDDMCDETPTVHVMRGWMRALLGRRSKIINFLRKYKEENPRTRDYPLFVTGHSLGGSLATLFGYFLAQEEDITANKPVTLYTFAAPPVGDADFGKVFSRLEDDGKLRYARIFNRDDVVPHFYSLSKHTHVGMGIELHMEGSGVTNNDSSIWNVVRGFKNLKKAGREHELSQSFDYMGLHSDSLDEMSLEEMYREKKRIG